MLETPRIAGRRVAVLFHLLAPNYRPQQVTDDLASFWRTTYHQVRKALRAFELVYRMGGEEFLIVLPGMNETQAIDTAEQLRETISHVRVAGDIGVTASLGISSGTGERIAFEPLYRHADEALYTAKRDGRDRTAVWTEPDPAIAAVAV